MRKEFSGYYAPTEAEYERLWKEGLIVLDTNVLLDLYRLPEAAREELFSVLDLLKDRLWIPYQVALEFQRRRLTVIASERKDTEDALSEANDLFEEVSRRVDALQMDKRGLGLESKPLVEGLKASNDKLIEAIRSVHKAQLDITISDPVRDKLDTLLEGKLGLPPREQADLDALIIDGQDRYDNRIPPGFADADKEKNPNEAKFHHDGLSYQRKFGDLILWRQLISHSLASEKKVVLFVTSDRKDDWWWRERGKTIGPRPELVREIQKEAGVDLFWMYSAVQFLENSKRFMQAQVSDASVTELKEVSRTRAVNVAHYRPEETSLSLGARNRDFMLFVRKAENSVKNWLVSIYEQIELSRPFPDFIINTESGPHGYEVKVLRNFSQAFPSPLLSNAMMRGYVEVNEGRLAKISIVAVMDKDEFLSADDAGLTKMAMLAVRRLLDKYPIYEVIVGFVDEDEVFCPVFGEQGRGRWQSDVED